MVKRGVVVLKKIKISSLSALAFSSLLMMGSVQTQAQSYPEANKPISIILPYPAGGPTDKAGRDLAFFMSKALGGHTVVVQNVTGASGSIGVNRGAKAASDGYTLLFTHIAQATLPTFFRKLPYNVQNDFEFLGLVSENPMNLIGRSTLPANNMKELLAWIQANKGKVNLANAGPGSAAHLCGMMFQSKVGVDMTSVPYKGTGPAMTDLLGGQVDLMCDQTTTTLPQLDAKKVKSFAVTTPERLTAPALKDTPTMQEAGLKDFTVTIWQGLYAPKGTPAPVLKKLNEALKTAIKNPDFIKRQEQGGATVITDARIEPAGHRAFVAAETEKWAPVINAGGIYAD